MLTFPHEWSYCNIRRLSHSRVSSSGPPIIPTHAGPLVGTAILGISLELPMDVVAEILTELSTSLELALDRFDKT